MSCCCDQARVPRAECLACIKLFLLGPQCLHIKFRCNEALVIFEACIGLYISNLFYVGCLFRCTSTIAFMVIALPSSLGYGSQFPDMWANPCPAQACAMKNIWLVCRAPLAVQPGVLCESSWICHPVREEGTALATEMQCQGLPIGQHVVIPERLAGHAHHPPPRDRM